MGSKKRRNLSYKKVAMKESDIAIYDTGCIFEKKYCDCKCSINYYFDNYYCCL